MTDRYEIHVPCIDVYAGLRADATRARQDQMPTTADRQDALALHLRNAERKMVELCPEGYHVLCKVVFELTPAVNAVLRET